MSKYQEYILWIGVILVVAYLFMSKSFRSEIFTSGQSVAGMQPGAAGIATPQQLGVPPFQVTHPGSDFFPTPTGNPPTSIANPVGQAINTAITGSGVIMA